MMNKTNQLCKNSRWKMSKNNEFLINITEIGLFSGLYFTIWLHDESLQDLLFEYQDELEQKYGKEIKLNFYIDPNLYLKKIANIYINCFQMEIEDSQWEIKELYSPKQYNYMTDQIVLKWTNAPKNAESIFNQFLEKIKEPSEIDSYDIFEMHTIFSEYNGCELIYELAEIHDNQGNVVVYDGKGGLELKPED